MMTSENSVRQIIRSCRASLAFVPLTVPLRLIVPVFLHIPAIAPWTTNSIRPSHFSHRRKALGLVDEILNIQHSQHL